MQLLEKIRKKTVAAINDYDLINDNDRIMVAVSGGKDSAILLMVLQEIQRRSAKTFSIQPVILDQRQPGFDVTAFASWVSGLSLELTVITEDTYAIVKDKVDPGKSFCGLCSRLRRGVLYNYAAKQGFTKIALGHHRDDLNETLLMNLLFNGRTASMPAKLRSDDGRNTVIRPFAYIPEEWLHDCAQQLEIPIIPCRLCGSQENLQRSRIKNLLGELGRQHPNIGASLLHAQQNVRASQLMDRELWNFND